MSAEACHPRLCKIESSPHPRFCEKLNVLCLTSDGLAPPSYLLKVISPHTLWVPATTEFLILRAFELLQPFSALGSLSSPILRWSSSGTQPLSFIYLKPLKEAITVTHAYVHSFIHSGLSRGTESQLPLEVTDLLTRHVFISIPSLSHFHTPLSAFLKITSQMNYLHANSHCRVCNWSNSNQGSRQNQSIRISNINKEMVSKKNLWSCTCTSRKGVGPHSAFSQRYPYMWKQKVLERCFFFPFSPKNASYTHHSLKSFNGKRCFVLFCFYRLLWFKFIYYTYLFLAALGLHCCAWAFL